MGGRWGWSQDGGVRADEALVETAASTFHPLCLDNREFRDDWGMRGSRRTDMPGVGDEFVAEHRFVHIHAQAGRALYCDEVHAKHRVYLARHRCPPGPNIIYAISKISMSDILLLSNCNLRNPPATASD